MSISVSNNEGNRVVTIVYEAPQAKADDTINRAARRFYADDSTFDGLTNQQKLDVIDRALRGFIVEAAKDQYKEAGAITIEAEADEALGLS